MSNNDKEIEEKVKALVLEILPRPSGKGKRQKAKGKSKKPESGLKPLHL